MIIDKSKLKTQKSQFDIPVVSASSEPNLVTQPQMWVDCYQIVYGGNEQDAKKAWVEKCIYIVVLALTIEQKKYKIKNN